MKIKHISETGTSIGIIGFGAFGQLIARHIADNFDVFAYDPEPVNLRRATDLHVRPATLEQCSGCDVVVIATPVSCFEAVLTTVAQYCRTDALILDVGSVKVAPATLMRRILPDNVNVVATHPLFGPQSAQAGLSGLKIALCPIRGTGHRRLARFLRNTLDLQVIVTSPDEHDREASIVQGLTHLIARVLTNMGPLPSRMTTRSFDLLIEAISMVQHDAPEVFDAIETANPYASDVRQRFFQHAFALKAELDDRPGQPRNIPEVTQPKR